MEDGEAATAQAAHSRRREPSDQCRRTPGARGRATAAVCQRRWPRPGDGRRRLRLRPGAVRAARASVDSVGQAPSTGRRREIGEQGVVAAIDPGHDARPHGNQKQCRNVAAKVNWTPSAAPFHEGSDPQHQHRCVHRRARRARRAGGATARSSPRILCGSLSHDTVWAKSDIDLVLVTIDDKKVEPDGRGALRGRRERPRVLMPRAEFRKMVEGSLAQLVHALVPGQGPAALHARPTRSPTSARGCTRSASATRRCSCCARRRARCRRSTRRTSGFVTRGDLDYTALWILYAATPLAQVEVIGARPAGRPRGDPAGAEAEPGVLQDDLRRPAQREEDAEGGARRRSTPSTATSPSARATLFAPVLDHLREVGEARSCSEIEDHFKRHFDVERRDHGLRVPGRPGADRQGVDAGPAHEEEQRRRAGAGLLLPGGPPDDD